MVTVVENFSSDFKSNRIVFFNALIRELYLNYLFNFVVFNHVVIVRYFHQ